jgi:hypothetical protein
MAQKVVSRHDLSDVFLVIDGERIEHGGDSALVEFEPEGSFQETSVSADGFVTVEQFNDERLNASIMVKDTSPAFERLEALRKEQDQTDNFSVGFSMIDDARGTKIESEEVIFNNYVHPNKEEESTEVTFELMLPYAAGDLEFTD